MPNYAANLLALRGGASRIGPIRYLVFALLFVLLFVVSLPIIALVWLALGGSGDSWPHLIEHVLPRSAFQTFTLLISVAIGTSLLGAGTAWVTTLCDFPGRKLFTWALMLPMAVPTYIAAYVHVEFLDYSGPVQTGLRTLFGYATSRDYWFPNIQSLGGAAFVFSLVLYPYVYLTTRLVFSMQGASALDASRSLGARPMRQFFVVGLPMARPALAAGVLLALMETMNDIGAVEILGVKTLGYAVFETWLNRDNLEGAIQLALLTLVVMALLVFAERQSRRGRKYSGNTRDKPPALLRLSRTKKTMCFALCSFPLLAGLGVPLWILGTYTLRRLSDGLDEAVLSATLNSVMLAGLTATATTLVAYGVLQFARLERSPALTTFGRIASLGYAVPGTVLSVGLLIPLAGFDNWMDAHFRTYFGISSGLLFSGTVAIVVYACSLRFLAIAYGTIETGFSRVSESVDMAGRALGRTAPQLAWQIHRPMMQRALGAAFLLVFVDTMKELSATLLLRPFKFETLATFVYERASQSALEDAASASLLIILIGLVPIIFLARNHRQLGAT